MPDFTTEPTPRPRSAIPLPLLRDGNGNSLYCGTAMPTWYAPVYYVGLHGIAATALSAYSARTVATGSAVSTSAYLLCMLLSMIIGALVRKVSIKRFPPAVVDVLPRVFSVTIGVTGILINRLTAGLIVYHGTPSVWVVQYIPVAAAITMLGLNILGTLLVLIFPERSASDEDPPDAPGTSPDAAPIDGPVVRRRWLRRRRPVSA